MNWSEDISDALARILRERDTLYDALGMGNAASRPPLIVDTYDLLERTLLGVIKGAPFHKEDRVRLVKTLLIDDNHSPGWKWFKHFLVSGAEGVVKYVRFGKDGYEIFVAFDNESYIDQDNVAHAVSPENRGHFRMNPEMLELIDGNK